MKERIKSLIEKLNAYRDDVVCNYLATLDLYDPKNGSMESVERAGILHDLDKHITNLHLELKRLEVSNG